jgi:hypothetical protein
MSTYRILPKLFAYHSEGREREGGGQLPKRRKDKFVWTEDRKRSIGLNFADDDDDDVDDEKQNQNAQRNQITHKSLLKKASRLTWYRWR